jgi:uncharacterized protein (TIGR02270 family)
MSRTDTTFALLYGGIAVWIMRERLVRAPNVRLVDLVRQDERLAAHLAAIVGRHDLQCAVAESELANPERLDAPELHFMAATLALHAGEPPRIPDLSSLAPFVAALAWADRDVAERAIERLCNAAQPSPRAIGIAALGVRRLDATAVLQSALADREALVRARAYRTTGQLGRADLMAQLRPGLTDPDPECRFRSAWAAARIGAGDEALKVLADIAWNNLPRADRALDLLLRRLDVPQANAWLREFAKLPDRQRALIRATGVIGDPLYIPWLIERMADPATARLAGESFCMITGLDLAYRDLDRRPPADFQSGPNDDPADENVALDEDENLPWPDPERIGAWWTANRSRFIVGTPYFLGTPKASADWLEALSDAFQRQRHAAALELAIRQPDKAMFEVCARGRLQRQLIARARGLA